MAIENSKNNSLIQIIESWSITEDVINPTDEILQWIKQKNESIHVEIKKVNYDYNGDWHYDKLSGKIVNQSKTFFSISGIKKTGDNGNLLQEQPIIVQREIGYLGIICKRIHGVMYFLMQAKIEPGNINKIQLSPTLQATKSNFMQAHGGAVPAYLDYFSQKKEYEVIVDQIQSEQSSRFIGKRNRNIIIVVDDEVEVLDSHKWMTLGQIKQLMKIDNLVNMDTRTVISCIPFAMRNYEDHELAHIKAMFANQALFNSMFSGDSGAQINTIYQYLNEEKMLDSSSVQLCALSELESWKLQNGEIQGKDKPFKVIFCNIDIEGREIRSWSQPLIEATGESIFGLIYRDVDHKREFLVHAISEIGCFDHIEIGPSVQIETKKKQMDNVEMLFFERLREKRGVRFDGLFSEEGGRFYHEQNRNILMEIEGNELSKLPEGYFWVDFYTLNILVQFNNCLNIQLRNLLSILDL